MSQEKGVFILIAGANASGKTTVIKPKYVEGRVKRYLDPDRLFYVAEEDILSVEARKEYELKRPDRFAVECLKNWLASERIRSEGIATESNLVTKHDFKCFESAKKSGMRTELYFVYVPLEIAKEREEIRAINGKQRKISEKIIEQRHKNGLPNIKKHIESGYVDVVMIYDNSRGRGEEQLLLHIKNGKTVFRCPKPPEWFSLNVGGAWDR